MLMPKKVKYRKQQRGRMAGKAWRGSSLAFGDFGLKAMDCGWITDRQIEAARVAMTRSIKRGGKVWIRLFPDKPITKKPAETRMGKGKGAPEQWVCVIRPGKILFEMEGVTKEIAAAAMRLAAAKIALPTKLVTRESDRTKARNDHEGERGKSTGRWIRPSSTSSCARAPSRCSGCGSSCRMGQMDGLKKLRHAAQRAGADADGAARAGTGSAAAAKAQASAKASAKASREDQAGEGQGREGQSSG